MKENRFFEEYNEFQKQFAENISERDRKMLALVGDIIGGRPAPVRLLDAGCSTGNLLLHLKRAYPDLELVGGDLAPSSLAAARNNPDLAGIEFRELNMLDIPDREAFDAVTSNAVAQFLALDEYAQAAASIAQALKPGGAYISFEWVHPFKGQDVEIKETTASHPDGLMIYARSQGRVAKVMKAAGFDDVTIDPFNIPIDLPMPPLDAIPDTYTRTLDTGERLCFRGVLYQPWVHVIAVKGEGT
ncbi:MAG: class I SAM-dependent methyltransferase [Rhodospirillales bacterium]